MSAKWGRMAPIGILAAALITAPQPAFAADFGPVTDLPGCPGFEISLSGTGGNQAPRSVKIGDDYIRAVSGGRDSLLTLTNESTGKSITVPTNGTGSKLTLYLDGGSKLEANGQTVFIFYPTDTGGARTFLVTGRAVLTNDENGTTTLQSSTGKQRDLCAELA